MTKSKKTIKPPVLSSVSTEATTPTEFKLTPSEMQLVLAYRQLGGSCKEFVFNMAVDSAEDDRFRAAPKRAALRLVSGGAS